jgi:Protein of unknown function (DUF3515)
VLHVTPAPHADAPACAQIMLNVPIELAGLPKRGTDGQATAAWGETDPVVMRCGVDPPPPTTDRCVTVTGSDGKGTDWLSVPATDGSGGWVLTSYGRRPAVEVRVPASVALKQPADLLVDLGPPVAYASLERTCL